MAKKTTAKTTLDQSTEKPGFFTRISLLFYNHKIITASLMTLLLIGGALSYTVWLRREGFPPVNVPISVAGGAYFVNDAQRVDREVAGPVGEVVSQVDGVESVTTVAQDNLFQIQAELSEDLTNAEGNERIQRAVEESNVLPKDAVIEYQTIDAGKFLGEYDLLVALYGPTDTDPAELEQIAQDIAPQFESNNVIARAEARPLFSTAVNPETQQEQSLQTSYGRFGDRSDNGEFTFYNSTVIGIAGQTDGELDIFQLSDEVRKRIEELSTQLPDGIEMRVAADYTEAIESQVGSLENNVLTGLIAVTIISALMISWRVSVMTAIFMVSVIFVTMLLLLAIGQTLNTITLFALVLALGLFVDDATIISEAIDAAKDPKLSRAEIIKRAINGVGSASFAGTFTTVLVFAPLLFIGGILGDFIFYLPFTVILALLVSLVLSLTLIPFLSHYIVLTGKNMERKPWNNPLPNFLADMIRKMKTRRRVGLPWAAAMFALSIAFFVMAGFYFSKLSFNIFPSSKDSDELGVIISYDPGTTIERAEDIADQVDEEIKTVIGSELTRVTYGAESLPNNRGAVARVELTSFREREVKAPELVNELESRLATLEGAVVQVVQFDAGPPAEEYPFKLQIFNDDPDTLLAAGENIRQFLDGQTIERQNGTTAQIVKTDISSLETVVRKDTRRYIQVLAGYDADDVSALVQTTQELLEDEYDSERLAGLGLSSDALGFDFGQESENEESFSALGPAGLAAIGIMLLLLILQFRSILKPLLIFLAMPFSFLGVGFGLYISDNPLSFFAMVGFIGLIGIAVNNSILLVDAANQERRRGKSTTEAMALATQRRFRPLFTTTATTVAALAPLAISDPFWEPLAITIMFGLLSSTLLVVLSFPVYYIAADALASSLINRIKRVFGRA